MGKPKTCRSVNRWDLLLVLMRTRRQFIKTCDALLLFLTTMRALEGLLQLVKYAFQCCIADSPGLLS